MEKQPYSQAEVPAAEDNLPDRGLECPKCTIVEVKREKGRVVMFACCPHYRGQSVTKLPFFFNAIAGSVSR